MSVLSGCNHSSRVSFTQLHHDQKRFLRRTNGLWQGQGRAHGSRKRRRRCRNRADQRPGSPVAGRRASPAAARCTRAPSRSFQGSSGEAQCRRDVKGGAPGQARKAHEGGARAATCAAAHVQPVAASSARGVWLSILPAVGCTSTGWHSTTSLISAVGLAALDRCTRRRAQSASNQVGAATDRPRARTGYIQVRNLSRERFVTGLS